MLTVLLKAKYTHWSETNFFQRPGPVKEPQWHQAITEMIPEQEYMQRNQDKENAQRQKNKNMKGKTTETKGHQKEDLST